MESFICGGAAAICAITCTHPIDVVKTRLQVQGELSKTNAGQPAAYRGIVRSLGIIARAEGVGGLYRGLLPAYGLQFSVTAVRFAIYDLQKRLVGEEFGKQGKTSTDAKGEQSVLRNFAMGAVGGVAGGVCGCPFYLLKTQFQTYSSAGALKAVGAQHEHKGVVSAFVSIGRKHGLSGYFRGLTAFLPRVCIYSGVQLSTYDGVKSFLRGSRLNLPDSFSTHLLASSVTTCAAVTALQPFDFLSTRLMNQADPSPGQPRQYANALDCAQQTLRTEGLRGFFKGAATNYARFTPYGILQLVLIEQFKNLSASIQRHV